MEIATGTNAEDHTHAHCFRTSASLWFQPSVLCFFKAFSDGKIKYIGLPGATHSSERLLS